MLTARLARRPSLPPNMLIFGVLVQEIEAHCFRSGKFIFVIQLFLALLSWGEDSVCYPSRDAF